MSRKLTQKLIQSFLVLAACCTLGACAFDSDDSKSSRNRKDLEDREAILRDLALVKGTYTGTLNDGISSDAIELTLYETEQQTGTSPDRMPIMTPVLMARLVSKDYVYYDHVLNARFFKETGELILSNEDSKSQGIVKSIRAAITGGRIEGDLVTSRGPLGRVSLNLTTRETRAPRQGDETELRDNILRDFALVEGTYTGTLTDAGQSVRIELIVYHADQQTGTNANNEPVMMPVLMGRLKTLDFSRINHTMVARFYRQTGRLIFSNPDGNSASVVKSIQAIHGENKITGDVVSSRGPVGKLELNLTAGGGRPDQGEEQELEERRRAEYQAVAGEWEGTVIPDPRRAPPFNLSIRLFVTTEEVNGRLTAVLKGYYRRLDSADGSLDLTMNVTYRPETLPPRMLMTSQGSSPRPRDRFASLDAQIINGELTGKHTDQTGEVADFRLRKK